ncbi:MAG: D-alanine--D-alanine ligase [Vicinamibacteria bacterium]|nr:D-alanine--D-alanine ligase [Vicinamibacteria bacterium]
MTHRIRVGILFGGASEERQISLASGLMIAEHLPKDLYEPKLLDTLALMAQHPGLSPELREKAIALQESRPRKALPATDDLPAGIRDQVERAESLAVSATQALSSRGDRGIDVAFLALHGKYGEDGTIQGFLELTGLPYTGSGVLASALAMDKVMSKRVLRGEGIKMPRGAHMSRADLSRDLSIVLARAHELLPAVVKPSKQGSSLGMSMVDSPEAMESAVRIALDHDDQALVEERIFGTEITVGVIGVVGSEELQALPVVEIVPKREFFDYLAKYDPDQCDEICPARISEAARLTAQSLAVRAHRSLGCSGYSRTDLILGPNGPVVLEVNTLPGMTMNSLLPKAAAAAGIPFGDLLHRIVSLALEPRG